MNSLLCKYFVMRKNCNIIDFKIHNMQNVMYKANYRKSDKKKQLEDRKKKREEVKKVVAPIQNEILAI